LKKLAINNELVNASFWSTIDTLGNRLIKFVFGIFIARLLLPEQVGLVVMLYIFLDVSMVISNAGFQSALVNNKSATDLDRSSVFFLNITIAILLSTVLYFSAKPIALFFGKNDIEVILKVLCIIPVINAFSIVHVATLHREMNLRSLAVANFPATIIPCIVALILASKGFGYWSLVTQQVLYTVIFSLFVWALSPFRPSFNFSISSINKLKEYALNLLGAEFINKIFNNIYFVVIGKFYTPAVLGFYSKANSLATLPSQSLTAIFSRVAFPAISKIQEQQENVSRLSVNMLTYTALIIWPFMSFLSTATENLIPFLLTEKWNASIRFMELLCIWGAIQATNKVNMDILQGTGRSGLILKIELLHKLSIVVGLLLTFSSGLIFIILGQIASSIFLFILLSGFCSKVSNISFMRQVNIYLPYFIFSVIIFFILRTISNSINLDHGATLLTQFFMYIFLYLGFLFTFKRTLLVTILKVFQR